MAQTETGQVYFFPWLELPHVVEIDEFQLLPWLEGQDEQGQVIATRSGERYADFAWTEETWNIAKAVFASYALTPEASIRSATVIKHRDYDLYSPLPEEKRDRLSRLVEAMTFSALAERELFGGNSYCNTTMFAAFSQGFKKSNPKDTTVVYRRRDGSGTVFGTSDNMKIFRPHQATPSYDVRVNWRLAAALLETAEQDDQTRILDVVSLFNLSNTDDKRLNHRLEIVLLSAAFERLLAPKKKGRSQNLVDGFRTSFLDWREKHSLSPKAPPCERELPSKYTNRPESLLISWLRDLYATRGLSAHGKAVTAGNLAWAPHEHLLLGSLVLPVAVKVALAELGTYRIGARDYALIQALDELAGHPNLFSKSASGNWPYREIVAKHRNGFPNAWLEELLDDDPAGK